MPKFWENDIKSILIDEETIKYRVNELGEEISKDYQGKNLVLIGILKGSSVFLTDLARQINLPVTFDFMSVSSYGDRHINSGVVRVLKDLDHGIEGKDVIIVEDIIDSGLTLSYLYSNLKNRGVNSIKICTLLDKPERRVVDTVKVDYCGFEIPDEFVVGYGLDFAEKYRNMPFVAALKEEIYL